jgi:hypothetical protein
LSQLIETQRHFFHISVPVVAFLPSPISAVAMTIDLRPGVLLMFSPLTFDDE